MRRHTFGMLASLGLLAFAGAGLVRAQYPLRTTVSPYTYQQGPRASPYLGLLYSPNSLYNYNYVVKPQLDFNQTLEKLKEAERAKESKGLTGGKLEDPELRPTGRTPGYMTHKKYFFTPSP